jgi:anti-sigma B factor antagonist
MTVTLSIQTSTEVDGSVRLALAGEIDLDTVGSLHDAVAAALRGRKPAALAIDLDGVTFIDSTGISGLVRARRLADAYRAAFRVINVTGAARWVLEVAGVLDYLSSGAAR